MLDSNCAFVESPEANDELLLRRLAIQLACQLPSDKHAAKRVLELSGYILENFYDLSKEIPNLNPLPGSSALA
ncbi:hypothetical protein [Chelatococcus asaccharovorans]|uniref:hypothetical protein n=1 Tax=Chelatococcus asaccharovorans TaxID=28210 RepID=UPI00224C65E9|nr:hypothetical protein [Chelatococcus asaccharovorans]CAH1671882.1 hypothetical protein CHELA17_61301 [Chelatococcus asaccharovorans]CAH1676711.1 hypothetical protein CHELA40_14320 [Chelatococcus asaccharovorans]